MAKSAVRLAREALAVGEPALPRSAARTSRHDDTPAQRFALLVLKQFFKTDDRGVVAFAAEGSDLRRAPRLTTVPHYSTRCYAERRLLKGGAVARLQATCFERAGAAGLTASVSAVTGDATGLERRHVSAHFVDRRGPLLGRRRRHGPTLTVVADVDTHLVAGAVVTRGPSQDSPQFPAAVRQAARVLAPHTLLGEAGYDADHNHRLCRTLGIAEDEPRLCGDRRRPPRPGHIASKR